MFRCGASCVARSLQSELVYDLSTEACLFCVLHPGGRGHAAEGGAGCAQVRRGHVQGVEGGEPLASAL
eukprot:9501432-Pyramimonas_sp.AAC.2